MNDNPPATRNLDLASYRDQNRVVLIFASSPEDAHYLEQQRFFKRAASGLAERDLIVVAIAQADDAAESLRRAFGIARAEFAVVLLGKDGGEKKRFKRPVTPDELFALIDQMPMRQREMREQG